MVTSFSRKLVQIHTNMVQWPHKQFPELHSIERLWVELKRRVHKQDQDDHGGFLPTYTNGATNSNDLILDDVKYLIHL